MSATDKKYDRPVSKLRVYRLIGNVRVPYTLVLDDTLLIVDDYPNDPVPLPTKTTSPAVTAAITEWVTGPEMPNRFPGTEALRAEFFAERDAMFAADPNCSGCQLGALINKYKSKLEAIPLG